MYAWSYICTCFLCISTWSTTQPRVSSCQTFNKKVETRPWQEPDCRNMEVSVAVYLVGGGLLCQAKNSLDLSWGKKKKKDRTSGCLAYGFIHLVTLCCSSVVPGGQWHFFSRLDYNTESCSNFSVWLRDRIIGDNLFRKDSNMKSKHARGDCKNTSSGENIFRGGLKMRGNILD